MRQLRQHGGFCLSQKSLQGVVIQAQRVGVLQTGGQVFHVEQLLGKSDFQGGIIGSVSVYKADHFANGTMKFSGLGAVKRRT